MNITIPTLCIATLFALTPTDAAQSTRSAGSRVPVDVTLEEQPAPPGRVPLVVRPATCIDSIKDQETGSCLQASSTPTFGLLFPYPGINNTFVEPAFVGGGQDNQATEAWSTVGGGRGNTASGSSSGYYGYATVGGGGSNTASGYGSTVGGGGANTTSGDGSTVGGGVSNSAFGTGSTVGGGAYNAAFGYASMVGGGGVNNASADGSTVGGGVYNTASGFYSTIGGGYNHMASGNLSTVPGGSDNNAQGNYSFAAGRRAKANHNGAFVWGDRVDADKTSSRANEFNVYCSGGARFFTNSGASAGVLLAPGGGSWSSVSDRGAKENVEPVDAQAVLEGLVAMPLATWNYKAQDDSIRHMGPMAQDFHAAFELGVSDKLIDTVDSDGVALAAIQGLNAVVRENEQRLAEKDAEIAELRARLERIEAALAE